jgi:hypothetical protein
MIRLINLVTSRGLICDEQASFDILLLVIMKTHFSHQYLHRPQALLSWVAQLSPKICRS